MLVVGRFTLGEIGIGSVCENTTYSKLGKEKMVCKACNSKKCPRPTSFLEKELLSKQLVSWVYLWQI